jgi:CRISPR/Cas system-associated protein Cas7 (RAMP superfamily)
MVISGQAAFVNLTEHEVYDGASTGKYSIVLTLDEENAAKMEAQGVKLRNYEGSQQRKFASKFDVPIYELNGDEFMGNITRGSQVRVQYSLGAEHPRFGITPYLDKVRVVELADSATDGDF